MSETPITDAKIIGKFSSPDDWYYVNADFAKELERENTRLFDLVRYQRAELHQAGLISDDEYTRLLADSKSKARLETYDDMRKEITRLRATLRVIADYDEQSIWMDSRDDAADNLLELAQEALKEQRGEA